MDDLSCRCVPVGILGANCYLVFHASSGMLYIIDPGGDAPEILNAARLFHWHNAVILLTHAHVDHISAVGEVAAAMNIRDVFLRTEDLGLYTSPENHLLPYLPAAANLPPAKWPPVFPEFSIVECPGHSPGGSAYFFKDLNALFVGDTLFHGSIGRTDLPGGSTTMLMNSIREKLMKFADDVIVYPGHGSPTSIGLERRTNPYLAD